MGKQIISLKKTFHESLTTKIDVCVHHFEMKKNIMFIKILIFFPVEFAFFPFALAVGKDEKKAFLLMKKKIYLFSSIDGFEASLIGLKKSH